MLSIPKELISERFHFREVRPKVRPSQIPYIQEVRSKLLNKEFKLVANQCPCGSDHDVVISEIDRFGLPLQSMLCQECGTVRSNPYFDEESLHVFYSKYYQEMYARAVKIDEYFDSQL